MIAKVQTAGIIGAGAAGDAVADTLHVQATDWPGIRFDWRTLRRTQQLAPDIPTVYLTAQQPWFDNIAEGKPEGSRWTAGIQARDHGGSVARMVKAAGGGAWSPYFGDVDRAKIDEAHALGLAVVVWTVNQPQDIERMLDLRVDGIISDRPDSVRTAMAARGMPLPRATVVTPY